MPLTIKEVNRIAELARLDLTADEKGHYRQQLSAILDHVKKLQELDTSDIAPTFSVLPPRSNLRKDEVKPGLTAAETLSNAPRKSRGQFQVPAIFGDQDE
jgi:aspartyl-tRNA(Asn)/glutamyl-tRNA(Gln) amidotransferase subunit C